MYYVFFSSPSLLRQLLFLTVLTFHIWYRLQSCYLFCLLCCGISTSEHHVKLKDWKLFVSLILNKYFSCLINIMRGKEYAVFSLSFAYWFECLFSLLIYGWTVYLKKLNMFSELTVPRSSEIYFKKKLVKKTICFDAQTKYYSL